MNKITIHLHMQKQRFKLKHTITLSNQNYSSFFHKTFHKTIKGRDSDQNETKIKN